MNTTQIFSNSTQITSPNQLIQSPLKQPQPLQQQTISHELECKKICLDRFKYVLFVSALFQYLLLMIFALLTLNLGYLNPVKWMKELFSVLMSPLSLVNVIYGICTLNKLLKEKTYCPTRIAKFMKGFGHESLISFLNLFTGLFTARLFMRCLSEEYKFLTNKTNELNESYSFLLLAGVFMRFYFYINEKNGEGLEFPIIYQSKMQQLRKEFTSTVKSSFMKSFMPTMQFIGFYMICGSSFAFFLRKIFFLEVSDASGLWSNFLILWDLKLVLYAWLLSSLILCHIQLATRLINIFATQPMQFSIANPQNLTITKALETSKFEITQHLAAQDLFMLADSANGLRRKEYYALSVPGSHPHTWKQLIKMTLSLIDKFTADLLTNVDYVAKNRRNDNTLNILNHPVQKFYENKMSTRDHNQVNGIRSFASASPTKPQIASDDEKRSKLLMTLKQKLLRNKLFAYLFGEQESGKLNFLLSQNAQVIVWMMQGIAALVARSLEEDNYGVVQHDIKAILKSFIKLKAALEKVSAINTIAKDRNLFALKATIRRSLYRITTNFSPYFEDMLIDVEDVRALHAFIIFKEL